jgi:hypothetical protein
MRMIYKSVNLAQWIQESTYNSKIVVELGAGFFDKLSFVNSTVKTKIGIEIYKPYIDNAKFNDCIKINGDILNYRQLLTEYELDTVMIVDVLEHFEKNVGYELINNLKNDFKKIILMLPAGKYEQNTDVTGFGGHVYQTHRSYWYVEDILRLNFTEDAMDNYFHPNNNNNNNTACYFGIWQKY